MTCKSCFNPFRRTGPIIFAGLLAAGISIGPSCSSPAGSRPNIILILADDMGYSDIGCYGGEIKTPNLDLLAAGGVRFSQFYNGARCCPTRASLLTGLYPHQAGIGLMVSSKAGDLPGYLGDLNDSCVTIAEVLKEAGYSTYMSGKWHVAGSFDPSDRHNWPIQRGFERFFGIISGAASYYDPGTLTLDNEFLPEPEDPAFYFTNAIGDSALGFLEDHTTVQGDKPFFLYLAFTSPHWPLHAPEEAIRENTGAYDTGWDNVRMERYERMKEMGILDPEWALSERDPRVPAWEGAEDQSWQARRMEVYASQVEIMDRNIGKLIRWLDAGDELDNTLIFFLSDNGGCAEELTRSWLNYLVTNVGRPFTRAGDSVRFLNDPSVMPGPENTYQSCGIPWANVQNTPFRLYKHFAHEGGISTPLIMRWPEGIQQRGTWIRDPGQLPDIMATIVDVARAEYPVSFGGKSILPMEGYSLMPLIGGRFNGREALFWEHEGNRAVRQGKWKLVSTGRGEWELYDMEADRTETENLAGEYPEKVNELEDLWNSWAWRTHVLPKRQNQ